MDFKVSIFIGWQDERCENILKEEVGDSPRVFEKTNKFFMLMKNNGKLNGFIQALLLASFFSLKGSAFKIKDPRDKVDGYCKPSL